MGNGKELKSRDWRKRLSYSIDQGKGFAAPGGEFTRTLYEWSLTGQGSVIKDLFCGQRVVELGAGMMPYGYALSAVCGARNFVAVEPFYSDLQESSIRSFEKKNRGIVPRIPFKVASIDMLDYLEGEADGILCVLACGIEDCILPGPIYRKKVEGEIERTLRPDSFFVSSHSDLCPQSLSSMEMFYRRPSNHRVIDRLRLHGGREAFEKHGRKLASLTEKGSASTF